MAVTAAKIAAWGAIVVAIIGVIGTIVDRHSADSKKDSGEAAHPQNISVSTTGNHSPAANMSGTTMGNNSPITQAAPGATANGNGVSMSANATAGGSTIIQANNSTVNNSPTINNYGHIQWTPRNIGLLVVGGVAVLGVLAIILVPNRARAITRLVAVICFFVTVLVFGIIMALRQKSGATPVLSGSVRLTGREMPAPPGPVQSIPITNSNSIATPILAVSTNALDFGTVAVAVTNYFTVSNAGSGVLTGTASALPPYRILSGTNYNLGAHQGQTVTIVFSPQWPMASTNNFATLTGGGGGIVRLTGHASLPKITGSKAAANAGGAPVLSVSTNDLDFGAVAAAVTNFFTISNAGSGILTGMSSTLPPYRILSETNYNLGAHQSLAVIVVFDPLLPMPSTNNFVTLTGGGGGSVRLTGWDVPLPGGPIQYSQVPDSTVGGVPVLAISTNALNFGAAATNFFAVSNAGGGALTGVASTQPPFRILSGANYNLGPNESQTVTIIFDPLPAVTFTNGFVKLTGGGGGSVELKGLEVLRVDGPSDLRITP